MTAVSSRLPSRKLNPCVRLFNYLLDATTGKKTKSTTTKYVCRNGTEATVKLSSEAVWLLSNDFVDLLPPLSSSRAGGAAIRAIEKELGKDFLWTLMERFATVLEERSKFLKKRAGVASGATPANVMLWGAGTSDGKRHTGVLSDIHALLQAMGVKHTKIRHPEAILRHSLAAKAGAKFDEEELSAFSSACVMEDVEGAASSRFLDVENATEADKEKFQSIMREIGKQVWKKPGKPGSEKRALFDAYMSRSLSPEDTEEVKERKRLNASNTRVWSSGY